VAVDREDEEELREDEEELCEDEEELREDEAELREDEEELCEDEAELREDEEEDRVLVACEEELDPELVLLVALEERVVPVVRGMMTGRGLEVLGLLIELPEGTLRKLRDPEVTERRPAVPDELSVGERLRIVVVGRWVLLPSTPDGAEYSRGRWTLGVVCHDPPVVRDAATSAKESARMRSEGVMSVRSWSVVWRTRPVASVRLREPERARIGVMSILASLETLRNEVSMAVLTAVLLGAAVISGRDEATPVWPVKVGRTWRPDRASLLRCGLAKSRVATTVQPPGSTLPSDTLPLTSMANREAGTRQVSSPPRA